MKIGIIGAMASEVESLIAAMTQKETVRGAGSEFVCGKLAGRDAVVVMCGIGKVCAGAVTQFLIDRFAVDAIVNTGVAGGLDSRLSIGDLVIANDAVQHDFDLTGFGYARGHLPCAGGGKDAPTRFTADSELSNRFADAFTAAGCVGKVVRGTGVSGDIFVCDPALKASLISDYGAAAVEMEGAAVAQVCFLNTVPFALVRAISDLAGEEANVSFDTFERTAAEQSARTILKMVGNL